MKNKCRVLALYLPQFHQTEENDEWWGEGFTEWNVVKAAKPLIENIQQPRVPQDGYYDLSDINAIKNQAKLARDNCVDGFIIYNYYSNGQLLLNKPSEMLLEHPEIEIEYCFSWANHDWMRTWFEYNKEMLRKQEYASNLKQIEEHFEYLLPFFNDSRYIKIDNKPVVFIYQHQVISNFELYRETWDKLAKKNGFDGIFFVQTLGGNYLAIDDSLDACFDFEPTYTTFKDMQKQHKINRIKRAVKKFLKTTNVCNKFDYEKVTDIILDRKENHSNHFLGVFAEWDNTPRHKHNGTVFTNFSLEVFRKQFEGQLRKSIVYGKELLIIDAWNEWGEGAYLEPDMTYGMKKLSIIRETMKKINLEFQEDK